MACLLPAVPAATAHGSTLRAPDAKAQLHLTTHLAPLTWHSRGAPLSQRGAHAAGWRERAAHHREALGVLGQRPAAERRSRALAVREAAVDDPTPGASSSSAEVAASAIAPPLAALATPPPPGEDDKDGEFWGVAMHIDLAQYVAYKNARFYTAARRLGWPNVPSLEHTDVWRVILEVIAAQRHEFRRAPRLRAWPDVLTPTTHVDRELPEQSAERTAELERWVARVEAAAETIHDEHARQALRDIPIAAVLRQGLSDRQVATGNLRAASETLIRAVRHGPGDGHLHNTPALAAWEDHIRCNYIRAHQCLRFGRLAVLSVREMVAAAPHEDGAAYTPELRARRARDRAMAMEQGLQRARRQLVEARRMLEAELDELPEALESQTFVGEELDVWRLGVRCAHLAALVLLGEAMLLLGRTHESSVLLLQAAHGAAELQADPLATPQLQRLLAAEGARVRAFLPPGSAGE